MEYRLRYRSLNKFHSWKTFSKHTHTRLYTYKVNHRISTNVYNKNVHYQFHSIVRGKKCTEKSFFSRATKGISGEWWSFATKNCSQFVKIFQHSFPLFPPSAYTGHRSASKTEVNRQSMGESINCPCYRRISMAVKKYRRNKPIYARNTGIYNIKFTPLSPFSSLGVKYYPHVFACMSYTTSVST